MIAQQSAKSGLYVAGLLTNDIRALLEEAFGLKVPADLARRVTGAVLEDVSDGQNRTLKPIYPIRRLKNDLPIIFLSSLILNALWVKIRDTSSHDIAEGNVV